MLGKCNFNLEKVMSDDFENEVEEEVVDQVEGAEEAEADEPDDIELAFDNAVSEGKEEDEIMLDMIQAGATFKNVRSRYNALLVDNGYLDSRAEKSDIVNSTLEGVDLTDEDSFNASVEALVEALKGVNAKSASASIRAYAKKNELECYKKPAGTGTGRSGITSDYHDWLIDNCPVTHADVNAWIETNGTGNTKRHAKAWLAKADVVNRAFNKGAGAEESKAA